MSQSIYIPEEAVGKEARYQALLPQLKALLAHETDLIANLANIAAALKEVFDFWWVGFYWVKDKELVLGPFQGPVACTRIAHGRGVCGAAWAQGCTQIVPDVECFPGHIACSAASRSEIVLPIYANNKIVGVLDIDSNQLAAFDQTDQRYLEEILQFLDL